MAILLNCLCLSSPLFALSLAVGCGMRAYKKGFNGFLFGFLFVFVCGMAMGTGMLTGIVAALLNDPTAGKDEIAKWLLLGTMLGGLFGMALMSLVTKLLPDRFAPVPTTDEPGDA